MGISEVETIFGDGYPIYSGSDISVYCVECAFTGSIRVVGKLTASLLLGITAASVTTSGPLHLGFNVAVIASYEDKLTYEKEVAKVALSPFTIPGVVTVGPELTFGVGFETGFEAAGGILAGIEVDWNAINIVTDLKNPLSSSLSGFSPSSVTKTLTVSGKVAVTGEVFVSVGLEFGIE